MSMTTQTFTILETKVAKLLQTYGKDEFAKEVLSGYIANKSLLMNHLYEDMGLKSRQEMGTFMSENFPTLAQKKPENTLWKKYLYDLIGEVAPACAYCANQTNCFSCKI